MTNIDLLPSTRRSPSGGLSVRCEPEDEDVGVCGSTGECWTKGLRRVFVEAAVRCAG